MLSNSSLLATESTSNSQEEKTMEVDEQQQSGKDQNEANNNEPIEMIESSSSSPKNTQKEDENTKNTPKSVDCIELLEDDENDSVGVVAEDIQRIEEDNKEEEEKEENEEREGGEEEEDDIKVIEEKPPAAKRPKIATTGQRRNSEWPRDGSSSPVPEDPRAAKDSSISHSIQTEEKEKDTSGSKTKNLNNSASSTPLNSYNVLLDRLELYVLNALDKGENMDRKVLDALLAAINIQVQKEPYAVRKLILDKQLVLPNTISFPPSQVVDLLIEHDPDHQLSRVINRLFGEERPKLAENERRERQYLRATNPAPNMTKLLMDMGQDLVQESTYFDIVHAKNLPEMPKNMDTYKQVAAQLRPVWQSLKEKNAPFVLKIYKCHVCGFKTESKMILSAHRMTLHYVGRRYQCTFCREFDTNENRMIMHITEAHCFKPVVVDQAPNAMQCPICDAEFNYKMCRRDLTKLRNIQMGRAVEDINVINRWLWDKPPIEPSILSQQQEAASQQRQQQLRQQQLQQQKIKQQQAVAAFRGSATPNQVLPSQQLLRQQRALLMSGGNSVSPSLASRLGIQQQTRNNQQLLSSLTPAQQKQLATLTAASLKAAGAAGGSDSSTIPTVGDVLRFAKDSNEPGSVAMKAQILQLQKNKQIQQKSNQILAAAAAAAGVKTSISPAALAQGRTLNKTNTGTSDLSPAAASRKVTQICEICDASCRDRDNYRVHLQSKHNQLKGKTATDMAQGAPLACSRCRERFWTYEGLERHLLMSHYLVTSDLLAKAQSKTDGCRCKLCGKN
uniref:C2H2-type domain-containing protein n=1 Tax=Meloidogyne floridensis TaxID=298350 RepID=A0A915PF80_9BILA